MHDQVRKLIEGTTNEMHRAAESIAPERLLKVVDIMCAVMHKDGKKIVVYGVGRERLMLCALAMRLYHVGFAASVFGDMSCPPLCTGDVLIVSAGPGHFGTVDAVVRCAKMAGADVACFTAESDGKVPKLCDQVVVVTGRTMANGSDDLEGLPMGSAYEGALFIVFEVLVELLRRRMHVSYDDMRNRHTNIE